MVATGNRPGVSVVICAYTEKRWEQTRAALESALGQDPPPAEVVLVVDHNPTLAERARREMPQVTVLESAGTPGLSGARNTGLKAVSQPVTAFLDDDAEARTGWLDQLVAPYTSAEVVATGGGVHPRWPAARPKWLPPEFDWVVGCSYRGLPTSTAEVRNPIGANMSMRTDAALEAGGFDEAVGRVGANTRGCEETELSIRMAQRRDGAVVFYVPDAAVDHHVAPERLKLGYFVRRCWHEGLSKADVVRLVGSGAGLERERRQTAVVIPTALVREARGLVTRRDGSASRFGALITGLSAAAAGYFTGRASQRLKKQPAK
jgi:glycosyltransferase involved in cell wall biosynthesis